MKEGTYCTYHNDYEADDEVRVLLEGLAPRLAYALHFARGVVDLNR
jgi:hypothetical protein